MEIQTQDCAGNEELGEYLLLVQWSIEVKFLKNCKRIRQVKITFLSCLSGRFFGAQMWGR